MEGASAYRPGIVAYIPALRGTYLQTKLSQQIGIAGVGPIKGTWAGVSRWAALIRSASTSALRIAKGKSS